MKGSEIKEFVESILDDKVDETLFLTLLNVAKDNVEDDGTNWEVLKKIDSSLTASPGDTYITLKTLPTDFRSPLGHIFVGDRRYIPIHLEQREAYKNSSGYFYIDYAQGKLAIIGAPSSSSTIYLPYLKTTEELTLDKEWSFPERFHKRLGFTIAGYITAGVDADDIYARMSPEHKIAAFQIENNMRRWNQRLALHAMDHSAAEEIVDNQIPLGMM